MMSMTFKRVLAAAASIGLAIIALSVVAGTLVETRGPRADRLPQVSLASPVDVGAVIAEVGSPAVTSVPPVPSVEPAMAPTTTITILVGASGAAHRSGPTDGDTTRSVASVSDSLSDPSRTAVNTPIKPPAVMPSGSTRAVSTATTIPDAGGSTKTHTDTHSTATTADRTSGTTAEAETNDHEVVPPTVREDHAEDH